MKTSKFILDPDTSIEVAHQGAHLCSWRCNGKQQLYLSPIHLEGKALRGGMPVIFPQFEEFGDGPRHGFARTANWLPTEIENGLRFQLKDIDPSWRFNTNVSIEFQLNNKTLTVRFCVENESETTVNFSCALHTYFLVNDIHQTYLHGLKGLDYWSNGDDFTIRKQEHKEAITFTEKIDRIYFGNESPLELIDEERTITIEHEGFEDVVVWNPWIDDAEDMADLPNNDYLKMLCVEPARVNNPVTLNTGEKWQGKKTIKLEY